MKKILIALIRFYQFFISTALKNIFGVSKMCRFSPTCSEYAKLTINKEGVFVGLRKSALRILKCQPFSK